MAIRVLPYVTIEVDDRLRRRVRYAADRVRINVRSYLLSAADDVDSAVDSAASIPSPPGWASASIRRRAGTPSGSLGSKWASSASTV
jgi:hypothetical protein